MMMRRAFLFCGGAILRGTCHVHAFAIMPEKQRLSFSHITVEDGTFALDDGVEMCVKFSLPVAPRNPARPPLIFIHGSFHSSWCWEEYFMPCFTEKGYPCIALSLRGTHDTPVDANEDSTASKVRIEQHVNDVMCLLQYIRKRACKDGGTEHDGTMRLFFDYMSENASSSNGYAVPPVLIAHSFGGLTAMKLLETKDTTPLLSTMALLCSVPPSGITKMSLRAIRKNPVKGWRIMRGLAMKKAVSESKLCRLLFFDADIPDEQLSKYQSQFQEDSEVTIDLGDLADKLPAKATDSNGCSTSIDKLQYPGLTLGGTKDYIVDSDATKETAAFLGGKANIVEGAVHDVMLAKCWREVANRIDDWLESCFGTTDPVGVAQ